jgi:hypothetical protein
VPKKRRRERAVIINVSLMEHPTPPSVTMLPYPCALKTRSYRGKPE